VPFPSDRPSILAFFVSLRSTHFTEDRSRDEALGGDGAACPDGSSEAKCVEKSHRFTKYVRPPRGVEAERPSSDGTC
jgi:hypothetical protein